MIMNRFIKLINEDETIKVYKNNIISTNLIHQSEECSYYDEQIYNVFDLINQNEEKNKEIDRLKNGYCELKVKCNNGECDCTNEEYDGMVQCNMKLSLEVDELNNIINELEKTIVDFIEKHTEDYLDWKYDEEIYNAQDRILGKLHKEFLDKLKELKEENK